MQQDIWNWDVSSFPFFHKKGVFGAVFWCWPESTIVLVVWELPIENSRQIWKYNNQTCVIYRGFRCVRSCTVFIDFWGFWLLIFWFRIALLLLLPFCSSSNFCLRHASSFFFLFPPPSSFFIFSSSYIIFHLFAPADERYCSPQRGAASLSLSPSIYII